MDLDSQFIWGIDYATRHLDWPFGIVAGVQVASSESEFANTRVHSQLTQWYIGGQKSWRLSNRFEATYDGGVIMVNSTFRDYRGAEAKRTDTGFGGYAELSLNYINYDRWQMGVSGRAAYALIDNISLTGADTNAGGLDLIFSFGGRF